MPQEDGWVGGGWGWGRVCVGGGEPTPAQSIQAKIRVKAEVARVYGRGHLFMAATTCGAAFRLLSVVVTQVIGRVCFFVLGAVVVQIVSRVRL